MKAPYPILLFLSIIAAVPIVCFSEDAAVDSRTRETSVTERATRTQLERLERAIEDAVAQWPSARRQMALARIVKSLENGLQLAPERTSELRAVLLPWLQEGVTSLSSRPDAIDAAVEAWTHSIRMYFLLDPPSVEDEFANDAQINEIVQIADDWVLQQLPWIPMPVRTDAICAMHERLRTLSSSPLNVILHRPLTEQSLHDCIRSWTTALDTIDLRQLCARYYVERLRPETTQLWELEVNEERSHNMLVDLLLGTFVAARDDQAVKQNVGFADLVEAYSRLSLCLLQSSPEEGPEDWSHHEMTFRWGECLTNYEFIMLSRLSLTNRGVFDLLRNSNTESFHLARSVNFTEIPVMRRMTISYDLPGHLPDRLAYRSEAVVRSTSSWARLEFVARDPAWFQRGLFLEHIGVGILETPADFGFYGGWEGYNGPVFIQDSAVAGIENPYLPNMLNISVAADHLQNLRLISHGEVSDISYDETVPTIEVRWPEGLRPWIYTAQVARLLCRLELINNDLVLNEGSLLRDDGTLVATIDWKNPCRLPEGDWGYGEVETTVHAEALAFEKRGMPGPVSIAGRRCIIQHFDFVNVEGTSSFLAISPSIRDEFDQEIMRLEFVDSKCFKPGDDVDNIVSPIPNIGVTARYLYYDALKRYFALEFIPRQELSRELEALATRFTSIMRIAEEEGDHERQVAAHERLEWILFRSGRYKEWKESIIDYLDLLEAQTDAEQVWKEVAGAYFRAMKIRDYSFVKVMEKRFADTVARQFELWDCMNKGMSLLNVRDGRYDLACFAAVEMKSLDPRQLMIARIGKAISLAHSALMIRRSYEWPDEQINHYVERAKTALADGLAAADDRYSDDEEISALAKRAHQAVEEAERALGSVTAK